MAPAFGQINQHPPQACHSGELWTNQFPNLQHGDFVHIPANLTVVLNTTTVNLGGMFIEGNLVFDHTRPTNTVHLNSAYIIVTGSLQIGCKDSNGVILRFTKRTSITLVGPEDYPQTSHTLTDGVHWPSSMDSLFGYSSEVKQAALDRGLIIAGAGSLYIYGNDIREHGWTTLYATVATDEDVIKLSDPLAGAWRIDDEIVIASTDFEYPDQYANGIDLPGGLISTAEMGGRPAGYAQGEERVILDRDAVTNTLTLDLPLDHWHWSASYSASFSSGPDTIEERAEVGNLTRSVVIQGKSSAISSAARGGTAHFGHVILLMRDGSSAVPYCEVDWAEFRNLGVEGKMGRYPFHWHMLGDARHGTSQDRPYLRDSSIHHCVNRFVTVHNTSYVDIERNVGYDTLGGGFFLEDALNGDPIGDEVQHVLLKDNLGMKVGRPSAFVEDYPEIYEELDLLNPSVFWIQHPNQRVEGNHAAGAAGHGFYLAPNSLADGYSHPPSTATAPSYFRNNVAHSNGQHGFYHQSRVQWGWVSGDSPAGEGLVAWKNRRYGIWWRTYGVSILSGCKVADNKSGLYPASEGRQNAHDGNAPPTCRLTIADSLIFGETPNVGEVINYAEIDAGRSLPQTYWYFTRPEAQSDAHESEWDTINGLESYDGQNIFSGINFAYFPASRTLRKPLDSGSSAFQQVTALTQVEYNSEFAEDPRNRIIDLEFETTSGQQVVNKILNRDTVGLDGFSMIRNTVVYDEDDSLGYGADVYVCYNDPFFEANATGSGTPATSHNLLVLPTALADFAQFQINATLASGYPDMTVTVNHHAGGTRSQTLGAMPGSTRDYAFNAPIGLFETGDPPNREGIYTCSLGGAVPSKYEIKIQFAEAAGLETIIGLPFGTVSIVSLNGSTSNLPSETTLAALLNSSFPNAYYHDSANSMLYIRTTTVILLTGGTPDVEGTRNVLVVE